MEVSVQAAEDESRCFLPAEPGALRGGVWMERWLRRSSQFPGPVLSQTPREAKQVLSLWRQGPDPPRPARPVPVPGGG